MQVNRGMYRGLKLETLDSLNTRPTSSKVKEAVFSMLYTKIYDAQVLDLFAGSGNMGIEALSSQAAYVDFYDNSIDAIKIIKTNTDKLKTDNYSITKTDYQQALDNIIMNNKQYDIIFLDPPYHLEIINDLLTKLISNNIIANDGIIVCESSIKEDVATEVLGFEKYKEKKYGTIKITMFRSR